VAEIRVDHGLDSTSEQSCGRFRAGGSIVLVTRGTNSSQAAAKEKSADEPEHRGCHEDRQEQCQLRGELDLRRLPSASNRETADGSPLAEQRAPRPSSVFDGRPDPAWRWAREQVPTLAGPRPGKLCLPERHATQLASLDDCRTVCSGSATTKNRSAARTTTPLSKWEGATMKWSSALRCVSATVGTRRPQLGLSHSQRKPERRPIRSRFQARRALLSASGFDRACSRVAKLGPADRGSGRATFGTTEDPPAL